MNKAVNDLSRRFMAKSAAASAAAVFSGILASSSAKADETTDPQKPEEFTENISPEYNDGITDRTPGKMATLLDNALGEPIVTLKATAGNQNVLENTLAPLIPGRTYNINLAHVRGEEFLERTSGTAELTSEKHLNAPEKIATIGYPHTSISFTIPADASESTGEVISYKTKHSTGDVDMNIPVTIGKKINNHPDMATYKGADNPDGTNYIWKHTTVDDPKTGGKLDIFESKFGKVTSVCWNVGRKDGQPSSKDSYVTFTLGSPDTNRFENSGVMGTEQTKKVNEDNTVCFETAWVCPAIPDAKGVEAVSMMTLKNENGEQLLSVPHAMKGAMTPKTNV